MHLKGTTQAEAQRLFHRAEEAFDRCTLPNHVDHEGVNQLAVDILQHHFGRG